MKRGTIILFAGVLLLNNLTLHSQMRMNSESMSRVVRIADLFDCYGVIFDSTYKVPIVIRDIAGRFTPNETDITAAEKLLITQYNAANQETESRKGTPVINDVKKYFWKFNRQYIGVIDKAGDKNLIIHLFDYSNKRVVEKQVGESWKTNFLIVFAENLPFQIVTYRVNINEGKLYATF